MQIDTNTRQWFCDKIQSISQQSRSERTRVPWTISRVHYAILTIEFQTIKGKNALF